MASSVSVVESIPASCIAQRDIRHVSNADIHPFPSAYDNFSNEEVDQIS